MGLRRKSLVSNNKVVPVSGILNDVGGVVEENDSILERYVESFDPLKFSKLSGKNRLQLLQEFTIDCSENKEILRKQELVHKLVQLLLRIGYKSGLENIRLGAKGLLKLLSIDNDEGPKTFFVEIEDIISVVVKFLLESIDRTRKERSSRTKYEILANWIDISLLWFHILVSIGQNLNHVHFAFCDTSVLRSVFDFRNELRSRSFERVPDVNGLANRMELLICEYYYVVSKDVEMYVMITHTDNHLILQEMLNILNLKKYPEDYREIYVIGRSLLKLRYDSLNQTAFCELWVSIAQKLQSDLGASLDIDIDSQSLNNDLIETWCAYAQCLNRLLSNSKASPSDFNSLSCTSAQRPYSRLNGEAILQMVHEDPVACGWFTVARAYDLGSLQQNLTVEKIFRDLTKSLADLFPVHVPCFEICQKLLDWFLQTKNSLEDMKMALEIIRRLLFDIVSDNMHNVIAFRKSITTEMFHRLISVMVPIAKQLPEASTVCEILQLTIQAGNQDYELVPIVAKELMAFLNSKDVLWVIYREILCVEGSQRVVWISEFLKHKFLKIFDGFNSEMPSSSLMLDVFDKILENMETRDFLKCHKPLLLHTFFSAAQVPGEQQTKLLCVTHVLLDFYDNHPMQLYCSQREIYSELVRCLSADTGNELGQKGVSSAVALLYAILSSEIHGVFGDMIVEGELSTGIVESLAKITQQVVKNEDVEYASKVLGVLAHTVDRWPELQNEPIDESLAVDFAASILQLVFLFSSQSNILSPKKISSSVFAAAFSLFKFASTSPMYGRSLVAVNEFGENVFWIMKFAVLHLKDNLYKDTLYLFCAAVYKLALQEENQEHLFRTSHVEIVVECAKQCIEADLAEDAGLIMLFGVLHEVAKSSMSPRGRLALNGVLELAPELLETTNQYSDTLEMSIYELMADLPRYSSDSMKLGYRRLLSGSIHAGLIATNTMKQFQMERLPGCYIAEKHQSSDLDRQYLMAVSRVESEEDRMQTNLDASKQARDMLTKIMSKQAPRLVSSQMSMYEEMVQTKGGIIDMTYEGKKRFIFIENNS